MSELNNHNEKKREEAGNEVSAVNETDGTADSAEAANGAPAAHPLIARDDFARAATTASHAPDSSATAQDESIPSQKRPLTRGQKIGVGIVAALSVVVIAVSAVFLFNPVTSESASNQGSATQVENVAPNTAKQDAAAQAQTPAEGDGVGEGQASSSDDFSPSSQQQAPSTPTPNSAQGDSDASSAPSGGSGSSERAPEQSAPAPAPATVTVSVSIDSSSVGSPVSGGTTATFAKGATAYDALMACGVSVNASNSAYGIYINAIGGLAEKEHGGISGWHYAVNGSTPGVSCSSYTLSDGDTVRWFYSI